MLQDPIVLAVPFETKLDNRPVTAHIISPPKQILDTLQKVCFAVLIIPGTIGFFMTLFNRNWEGFSIACMFMSVMCVAVWVVMLRARMVWTATWYTDRVEVEDGRYGRSVYWSEPLSAFAGLETKSARLGTSGGSRGFEIYGLMLAHPDPEKSLLLYSSGKKVSEDVLAYYAEHLDQEIVG